MKILVAEDDAVSRRVIETLLQQWGHEAVTAEDGELAWHAASQPGAPACCCWTG